MPKAIYAFLVFVMCGAMTQGISQSSSIEARNQGISAHCVQPQHAFGTKDSIPLRVEVTNEGEQTLLMCRDLDIASDFCNWDFEVYDASGRPVSGWKMVGDRVEGHTHAFPNVLISNWIALAPHYAYGTTIDLALFLGPDPLPGRYKVKATLSSSGPGDPSTKNDLVHYPKELAALPFPGWKGKAESNWVWVEIVKSSAQRRTK